MSITTNPISISKCQIYLFEMGIGEGLENGGCNGTEGVNGTVALICFFLYSNHFENMLLDSRRIYRPRIVGVYIITVYAMEFVHGS